MVKLWIRETKVCSMMEWKSCSVQVSDLLYIIKSSKKAEINR